MNKDSQTGFSMYDRLSADVKTDVDKCIDTYHKNGKGAAEVEFRQIASTYNLTRWEIAMLGDTIRTRLIRLGYLPIGGE